VFEAPSAEFVGSPAIGLSAVQSGTNSKPSTSQPVTPLIPSLPSDMPGAALSGIATATAHPVGTAVPHGRFAYRSDIQPSNPGIPGGRAKLTASWAVAAAGSTQRADRLDGALTMAMKVSSTSAAVGE